MPILTIFFLSFLYGMIKGFLTTHGYLPASVDEKPKRKNEEILITDAGERFEIIHEQSRLEQESS